MTITGYYFIYYSNSNNIHVLDLFLNIHNSTIPIQHHWWNWRVFKVIIISDDASTSPNRMHYENYEHLYQFELQNKV
jgi:hypothetical protein